MVFSFKLHFEMKYTMHGFANRILIAAETASHNAAAVAYLRDQGMAVHCVYSGRDALSVINQQGADCVLADIDVPDGDALWLLDQLGRSGFRGPVIVSAAGDFNAPDQRHREVRKSAFFVYKPIGIQRMHTMICALLRDIPSFLHFQTLEEERPMSINLDEIAGSSKLAEGQESFGGFIGTSPVMLSLYEQIQNAARSTASVFITGESGTGKDVCAQAVHKYSARAAKNFVPLNCAAIPRDLLESELFGHVRGAFTGAIADRDGAARSAHGGTLFLDEIGDMDPNMQTKLLRFLQDGTFLPVGGSRLERVDVRIICATNRDPFADVKAGRLREDLFYRLHVLPLPMPPLRARGDDVIDIAQTLLLRYAAEEGRRFKGFGMDAEMLLRNYRWPGNIRQLQNIIRQAVVMHDGPVVTAQMIPVDGLHNTLYQDPPPASEPRMVTHHGAMPVALGTLDGSLLHGRANAHGITPLHIIERRTIEHAIAVCAGNIPRAAAMLEISPSTIYRKKALWDGSSTETPAGQPKSLESATQTADAPDFA